ncbi:uncharacterized protein LOC123563042 isoform X2 [Mercenaria mercenaria]|uniref:uncharacterized protein LOC123563042 isoform X2 n=1 Tax=Mercenaria mercenaria TaxID=6596 RepID=UPI00234F4302|nr:uncharacterized protein LOC123563042 isoform X2 [Mercenaria mercenaria]
MESDVTKNQLTSNLSNNPVPVSLHPVSGQGPVLDNHAWKPMDTQDSQDTINQVQEMLEQISSRGVQSMLVTVGPFGEIGIHGSQKGQLFLKENSDIGDRFAKMCTDHDVWALLGAQKRFIEIGRSNQNKGVFNEKGDYPLDFSHERGSYFPAQAGTSERVTAQDNTFVQGILSQGGNQNKTYQSNTFLHGNFSQYDARPNFHTGSFFQGGFSQGLPCSESFPQPNFMQGIDATANNMGNPMITVPQTNMSVSPTGASHDKNNGITQSEADLIKEMLNSTPVQEVINSSGKSSKEKLKSKEKSEKEKEALKRKRERRPETWQRNVKKKLKTEGKAYVNAKGKLVPAKYMRTVDCTKCKQRCTEKISEETRKKIFEWFWKLGSYTAQKEFVVSRVTQVATKTSKRRHVHRLFSFEINGKYESVCKPFFSRTLGIGDSYIYKAFEQKARDLFVQDGRGKHAPVNKTSEEQIDSVHKHLDAYLAEYPIHSPLPKSIHAVKWYDEYLAKCSEEDKKPVSKHIYRKIFQEYVRKYPTPPEKKKSEDGSGESSKNIHNATNNLSNSSFDSS